jgi:hypothetical protein
MKIEIKNGLTLSFEYNPTRSGEKIHVTLGENTIWIDRDELLSLLRAVLT